MRDLSIDNSSLSLILADQTVLDKFAKKLISSNLRLVVSGEVLDEMVCGDRPEKIKVRTRSLATLWNALAPCGLTISRPSYQILTDELRRKRDSVPTVSRNGRRNILANLSRYDPAHPAYAAMASETAEVKRRKVSARETDLALKRKITEIESSSSPTDLKSLVAFIEQYKGPTDSFQWFLETLLGAFNETDIYLIVAVARIRDTNRYPALKVFLSLAELTMHGAVQEALGVPNLWSVKRNNWYDNAITSCASYSAYFVCDDDDALKKAAFLVKHGIASFRPLTLSAFLSQGKDDLGTIPR